MAQGSKFYRLHRCAGKLGDDPRRPDHRKGYHRYRPLWRHPPDPCQGGGNRKGAVPDPLAFADAVLDDVSAADAIDLADDVWTITSTLGFEALLRGKRVTCLGQPFYAGWGLTDDRARPIPRRQARPDIVALANAALIAYPRYFDPVTGMACPVEVALGRLESGEIPAMPLRTRIASEIQDLMAFLGLRR